MSWLYVSRTREIRESFVRRQLPSTKISLLKIPLRSEPSHEIECRYVGE